MDNVDNLSALLPSLKSLPRSVWLVGLFLGYKYVQAQIAIWKLSSIPTAGGPSGVLSSYLGAIKRIWFGDGRQVIQEGIEKFGKVFKCAQVNGWVVIVTGRDHIEELRSAPEEALSFNESANELVAMKYTLGAETHYDPYHVQVVRGSLTRNIGNLYHELHEEIQLQFASEIPLTKEWTKMPAYRTVLQIVSGTSNRLFVGLPLCRDPDYKMLNVTHTVNVIKSAFIINTFPTFMQPLVAKMCTPLKRSTERAIKHLQPLIEERMKMQDKYGRDYPDKPNDMLSWLLDEAYDVPERRTVYQLTQRILTLNFAAIHTSSAAFTDAVYFLAAHPEYADPMREEIQMVVEEEGWTKAALTRMRKVDSFIRESQRLTGVHAFSMHRRALKDFTFSDGTTIPAGQAVAIPGYALHHDGTIYDSPDEFDGFRFAKLREADEHDGITKYQMVNTTPDYVTFGHGKHACPGRFFAAAELKTMFCHLLLNYDVKFEDRPPVEVWRVSFRIIDTDATVSFRARSDSN